MSVELNLAERVFLLKLLEEHREYYRTLTGNPKCMPDNRQTYIFIETLCQKLEPEKQYDRRRETEVTN